jgi:hypothetical protein
VENHAVRLRERRRPEHGLPKQRRGQGLRHDDARTVLQAFPPIFRYDHHRNVFRRTDPLPGQRTGLDPLFQR